MSKTALYAVFSTLQSLSNIEDEKLYKKIMTKSINKTLLSLEDGISFKKLQTNTVTDND